MSASPRPAAPIRVAHVATVDLTHRFLLLPQLAALRAEGFDVTAISAPGPYVPDLEAAGIRHVAWTHVTRAWDPRSDALAFAELLGILRRERFRIVHTHTPKAGVMGRVAARAAGVPVVVNTVHGFYATPEHPLRRRLPVLTVEWAAAQCSDLELFQSAEDLAWARRLRMLAPGHGVHLGNGTDLTRFDAEVVPPGRLDALRRELGIPASSPVVGTVGRMVAEKGYRELFTAARAVHARLPAVRFLAVGERDPDKADAVTQAEMDEARPFVVFAGWRADVRDLLALMDVFVLPSWREGLPRSPIEAGAMGRPLVLTDIRGCREIVRDGVDGLLVPPRDPAALAGAIAHLLEDPDLRMRMGRAARRRMVERFDEQRVIRILLDSYRRLLGGAWPPVAAARIPEAA